eukprot:TRINITY_DN67527_c2_g1_i1.p1 TRINITY_DN67527_c2_g1~~TRINITY_DN67527_c2_g1_i1.p1  ORF type:complete len:290 (+),score=48.68 TRINITY_DN67527_c2_g1_i1:69-938(+)
MSSMESSANGSQRVELSCVPDDVIELIVSFDATWRMSVTCQRFHSLLARRYCNSFFCIQAVSPFAKKVTYKDCYGSTTLLDFSLLLNNSNIKLDDNPPQQEEEFVDFDEPEEPQVAQPTGSCWAKLENERWLRRQGEGHYGKLEKGRFGGDNSVSVERYSRASNKTWTVGKMVASWLHWGRECDLSLHRLELPPGRTVLDSMGGGFVYQPESTTPTTTEAKPNQQRGDPEGDEEEEEEEEEDVDLDSPFVDDLIPPDARWAAVLKGNGNDTTAICVAPDWVYTYRHVYS